ncbi:PREDICTED: E3 ubiquitin-protein ligase TRIM31 [Elephantulus edwardii]|uniref:E3 ubiquitin-protein ligase TRIM31 n=1 Tax=Elephantulus edwardii TaxID=28737 RepID=UPI0003F0A11B|nr:PREDICTED: E3 ubiquitin-protein ligase TRIM31 [Elephantulus edwardii]
MANTELINTLQEEVICPICIEILQDPVTIDCGHNFCMKCITQSGETPDNLLKCPLCNKTVKRDTLRPNWLLVNLVEKIQAMSPVEVHPQRNDLKCQKHQEKYHYFCEYDGMFLCTVCCNSKEHKSHQFSLIEEAAQKYQEKIQSELKALEQKAKTIGEVNTQGRQRINVFMALVEHERQRVITEFKHLHQILNEEKKFLLSRLAWLSQEGAKGSHLFATSTEAQLIALNKIADNLKAKQQMSPSDMLWDIKVILYRSQGFQFLHPNPVNPDLEKKLTEAKSRHSSITEIFKKYRDNLQSDGKKDKSRFVGSMNETLMKSCSGTEPASPHPHPTGLARSLSTRKELPPPLHLPRNRMSYVEVPRSRSRSRDSSKNTGSTGPTWREEVKVLTPVVLDAASAHPSLVLSQDLKRVKLNSAYSLDAEEPADPASFYPFRCVLGSPGFSSGRHAWEVELQGPGGGACVVGVASEHAARRGFLAIEPMAGFWCLRIVGFECQALTEDNMREVLPYRLNRVGVCVDHDRGEVAFYDTSTGKHIYTFHACFPGQIFPFFRILFSDTQITLSP